MPRFLLVSPVPRVEGRIKRAAREVSAIEPINPAVAVRSIADLVVTEGFRFIEHYEPGACYIRHGTLNGVVHSICHRGDPFFFFFFSFLIQENLLRTVQVV